MALVPVLRTCYLVPLIFTVLLSALWLAWGHDDASNAVSVLDNACHKETGVRSRKHETALNTLSGRHLVFVGDSISRYQYLELAYYAIHGMCPHANSQPNLLVESTFASWDEFYRVTSQLLTVTQEHSVTRERCFCHRLDLKPGNVMEQRTFQYDDAQGRSFVLSYVQYFGEHYDKLESVMASMGALNATDVVLNFGVWQRNEPADCALPTARPETWCPPMAWLCDQFRKPLDYTLRWQTTTPMVQEGVVKVVIPPGHHLDVPHQCQLAPHQVVNRAQALDDLEPDVTKRTRLFHWSRYTPHFYGAANHGFNHVLLQHLEPKDLVATARTPGAVWQALRRGAGRGGAGSAGKAGRASP